MERQAIDPARPRPASLGADPSTRGRELLETHLDLIQRKLHYLSWRGGLPASEAEDFCSWALLKLVADDYRILSRWEGRSSFSTFLTVVLVNLMRDYRIHLWGKRRPCKKSCRQERRWVGEEELLQIPVDGQVEIRIEEEEQACMAERLRNELIPLLQALPAEDRLLLKLCFLEGLSMVAIAPILGRPQRELYSRRDRCMKKIRRSLDGAGLGLEQVRGLLERFQESLGLEACLQG
jgi:RNA polymerase sigma factor (sigma-70 family)